MSKLKSKLDLLYKKEPLSSVQSVETPAISTRERLERLVASKLKHGQNLVTKQSSSVQKVSDRSKIREEINQTNWEITVSKYALSDWLGPVQLAAWHEIPQDVLATLFKRHALVAGIECKNPLFIDTETTGLSGGTGTLAFMIGSGYFSGENFFVQVMTLRNPSAEGSFLKEWIHLVETIQPDCLISFNGRAFDLPLLESRFILNRIPWCLGDFPHYDFLYPARILWGWVFPSRRLGILGEKLLGLSRADDIDGALIPALFYNYLRSGRFSLLDPIIRHNALDIVGLAGLVILASQYLQDASNIAHGGEHLGAAILYERDDRMEQAEASLYRVMASCRDDKILAEATKRLALCKKRKKLYEEAAALWHDLLPHHSKQAFNELIAYYGRREGALGISEALVREALQKLELTPRQQQQLQGRLALLIKKKQQNLECDEDALLLGKP